jgi:hypothetical protein
MQIPYAHDQGSTIIMVGLQVGKIIREELFSMASWWKVLQRKNALNKIQYFATKLQVKIQGH